MLLTPFPLMAAESHRGAIVCRGEISEARRVELAHQLQLITGWSDLNFDRQGSLRVGQNSPAAGSRLARNLIASALLSGKVLILEDASNRADVVFARVVPGRWKTTSENRAVFVVLIDFADFEHLMGDRQALAAFNAGWSVLHEVDHVVTDSADSAAVGHTGECEDHINEMRRECHLPARMDYFFRFFPNSEQSDFQTRLVRLAFEQSEGSKKHRRFWVIWDASQVGGLESAKQVATLR